jgi:hypothetical protein
MGRTRKLVWTFKTLRHVASDHLLRLIYVSLAQSVLTCCITVWGGAIRTRLLDLERAQRSLLKVMYYQGLERSTMLKTKILWQRVARQSREVTPTFLHMRNSLAREQFENYHERVVSSWTFYKRAS